MPNILSNLVKWERFDKYIRHQKVNSQLERKGNFAATGVDFVISDTDLSERPRRPASLMDRLPDPPGGNLFACARALWVR